MKKHGRSHGRKGKVDAEQEFMVIAVSDVCGECRESGHSGNEHHFPLTGRRVLLLDVGFDSAGIERIAAYVAAKIDFPMNEPIRRCQKSRVAAVLRAAAQYAHYFLTTPRGTDREECRLMARHLGSLAWDFRRQGLLGPATPDDVSIAVAALERAAVGTREVPS